MTGYYAATSTNIHVRVHFNLTQVFKTKQNKLLAETYLQLEKNMKSHKISCEINYRCQFNDH